MTVSSLIHRCGPALAELTGQEVYMAFGNGTMALSAAITALSVAGERVDLPALGCWTLTRAALDCGAVPTYRDVTWRLQGEPASSAVPHVVVRPWCGELGPEVIGARTILDLSVNCAPTDGSSAAAACVISMGPSKPAASGRHGGVLAFSSPGLVPILEEAVAMRDDAGRWSRLGPRLTGGSMSEAEIDVHFAGVLDGVGAAHEAALIATGSLDGFDEVVRPIWPEPVGHSYFMPLLLADRLGVSASDVARLAATRGVPIGTQPVAPAYREPAMARLVEPGGQQRCPVAEELADRLVYLPAEVMSADAGARRRTRRFLQWLGVRTGAVGTR